MPDSSPYLEAAYAVFVLLLVIYVAIITLRVRRTARERRSLEAQLAEREVPGERIAAGREREEVGTR